MQLKGLVDLLNMGCKEHLGRDGDFNVFLLHFHLFPHLWRFIRQDSWNREIGEIDTDMTRNSNWPNQWSIETPAEPEKGIMSAEGKGNRAGSCQGTVHRCIAELRREILDLGKDGSYSRMGPSSEKARHVTGLWCEGGWSSSGRRQRGEVKRLETRAGQAKGQARHGANMSPR